jgi:hypothetical protein
MVSKLGLQPQDYFKRVPGLHPSLEFQKKTFFPNLCHKIFAETFVINQQKVFFKTAVFDDFRVHLGRKCSISFEEDFQMFFSTRFEEKNKYDTCLEEYFRGEERGKETKSGKPKKQRVLEFEMVWKRSNKFKITSELGVYQESVRELPKNLSQNKREVGRFFLFQGGFLIFYSDLSK